MTVLHPRLTDWQVPEGFEEVESGLDGVVVCAPRPDDEAPGDRRTFRCPNCGATTGFDEGRGALHCDYCDHTAEVRADRVGQAADDEEFTLEALAADETGWGTERRELHCASCGTSLSVEPGTLSTSCPFCASNQVDLREAAESALRPRFLIPFSVEGEAAAAVARQWLGRGWIHPAGLAKVASVERFSGVYLAYWTFSATLRSTWEAEVGYERSESYYDSSADEWRTRTVIDWEWEQGAVSPRIDDLLVPGTARLSQRILDQIADFDLGGLAGYAPGFLAGWTARTYDIPLPDAWDRGRTVMRERARSACQDDIPTNHVRNFSMAADFDDERWRLVLLPIWISAYRFNGRVFRVMVNGQTGTVAGQKPVAWWKIWLGIAALFTPSLSLGLVGLVLLVFGIGIVPLVIAFFLLIPALIFSVALYRRAVDSEAE